LCSGKGIQKDGDRITAHLILICPLIKKHMLSTVL
jgi:hypothetical protein